MNTQICEQAWCLRQVVRRPAGLEDRLAGAGQVKGQRRHWQGGVEQSMRYFQVTGPWKAFSRLDAVGPVFPERQRTDKWEEGHVQGTQGTRRALAEKRDNYMWTCPIEEGQLDIIPTSLGKGGPTFHENLELYILMVTILPPP